MSHATNEAHRERLQRQTQADGVNREYIELILPQQLWQELQVHAEFETIKTFLFFINANLLI